MAVSFFQNLLKEPNDGSRYVSSDYTFPALDPLEKSCLVAAITEHEIQDAMFSIGGLKAPGDDGYPTIFFHQNWDVVKRSVCDTVYNAFNKTLDFSTINNTLLVLIPKVEKPEFISQFRPISLCNVIYKCITKIIVNRLKPILPKLISPCQVSFIPG